MDDKYISLITRYLSGELSDKDREVLFGLVNSSEERRMYFEEMQQLWELSTEEVETPPVNVDIAWEKVSGRLEMIPKSNKPEKKARFFKIGPLLRIAALFAGIIIAFLIYRNQADQPPLMAFYETSDDEKREIQLPDGSTVWLNENSKLSYKKDFEPRMVNLDGEGFFDVKHLDAAHPFEILSGDTKTRVLGTSFNVRAYPVENQIEVTVKTGKVLVENQKIQKTEKQITLTAGESGVYQKQENQFVKPKEIISNANAWKTRQLEFKDASIAEVVEVMERYFDIEIITENEAILNCPLTGAYKDPDIDQLIEVLKFSLDIDIKQNENKLIFSGEGCE